MSECKSDHMASRRSDGSGNWCSTHSLPLTHCPVGARPAESASAAGIRLTAERGCTFAQLLSSAAVVARDMARLRDTGEVWSYTDRCSPDVFVAPEKDVPKQPGIFVWLRVKAGQ